jgi:hypothetical protein
MKFIHLERDVRAMPLSCSAGQFYHEWHQCWEDETRDTTRLFELVEPFIQRWADHLRNPTEAQEINFVSLMGLLQSNGDPFELVHNWTTIQDTNSSVEEELRFLFLERLRGIRFWIARHSSATYYEYMIARDFKLFLRNRIRDCWTATRERPTQYIELAYEPEYPDWFMIQHLGVNHWHSYLGDYILEGRTKELQITMNWSHQQLTEEVNNICQPIKKWLQSN